MNALTGKATYGEVRGNVFINGKAARISDYRSQVGFVPQDDIVFPNLTVRENLLFNALLRLPRNIPTQQKLEIVVDVIKILGLSRIQNSIVGNVESRGISGGQRKRVNIGMELVAYPDILFLDEPTSGLDSTASLDIISSLKDYSRLGVMIVAVIHQPRYSLFKQFDSVLLLGLGGRTVYLGATSSALDYFENIGFKCQPLENPADFVS